MITLRAEAFAWGVWLDTETVDCRFSDNGFVLLPQEEREITAVGITVEALQRELSLTSIWDVGR